MSTELQAPFGLSPSGGVAVVSTPGLQVQQHLQSLVSTQPGERVMRPGYGVPLVNRVFDFDVNEIAAVVANDVSRAVTTWEPSINLKDVQSSVSDTTNGLASINVRYSPGSAANSSATVTTATVLVGGSVVGNG
jgi:uncharacterized protein